MVVPGAKEIAARFETEIRDGRRRPGEALPPVRALAAELRVSPGTVASAYHTLRLRGLAGGQGRRGTRVSARPPVALRPRDAVPETLRDLASGNPDPALLPALNAMFDIMTTRTLAMRMHPPLIIFVMLFVVALASALLAGHGLAGAPRSSRR